MKSVDWSNGNYGKIIGGKSMKEAFAKAATEQQVQESAEALLKKAFGPMLALLEIRLQNRTPLRVMRPLVYPTSEISKGYNPRFQDTLKRIEVGTELVMKALDSQMNEFIFEGSDGQEHAISFDQRNLLMTQTNIYETVTEFITHQG